uniref:Major facilitator superfamily (MFS) profile domain-containing protein n=2 Tax=Amorphochlora amoebiformis TaxID=1561963 RepID=A0A7S0DK83_9EUKA|mmetsp:Transcript_31204/g.50087  ORF Transcript_31204/g.50087 Transcript_31204/m.50087 type:complete len:533 (+) Transcript_31204:52-1650(+)
MTVSHSYRALSEGGDGDGVEGYGHVLRDRRKVGELGWRERLCRFFTPMRTIWMFVGVNILNYLDRGIIPGAPNQFQSFIRNTIMIDENQESTYLGILQSVFIASYSLAVIAAGNLVHKYPPFLVMGMGLAIWCVAVFISGAAQGWGSFWLLLFGRTLSGVGEASFQCIAPAFIEDFSPPGQKVLMLGIFFSSITVGTAGGYAYSAVISTSWGWAWSFWLEGVAMIPFVVICCLLPFKLNGDNSNGNNVRTASNHASVSLSKEVSTIMTSPLFINISIGYSAYCAVLAGLSTFGPIFFQGLQLFDSERSASLHFSAIVALAGVIGTPIGGYISDRLAGDRATRDQILDTCLKIMAGSSLAGLAFALASAYCQSKGPFLFLMGTAIMLLFLPTGCCTMAVMASVPSNMRATGVALSILIMHLFGDVPSPVAVGWLKDRLAPRCNTKSIDGQEVLNPLCVFDGDGIRLTLVICLSYLAVTVLFWTVPILFPDTCGKPAQDPDQFQSLNNGDLGKRKDSYRGLGDVPDKEMPVAAA